MAESSLTKRPEMLYEASLEYVDALVELHRDRRGLLAAYVSGLAVECVLQPIALHHGATDDAKHDLRNWLRKCPSVLQRTISETVSTQWSFLNLVWTNRLRYLSRSGLYGHLKALELHRGLKGDQESIFKVNAKTMVDAARAVHNKGIKTWAKTY